MAIVWRELLRKSRKWLGTAWLVTAGLVALYLGVLGPLQDRHRIAEEKASGLAPIQVDLASVWRPPTYDQLSASRRAPRTEGVVGGVPGGRPVMSAVRQAGLMTYNTTDESQSAEEDRKMIRTGSMDLIVEKPAAVAEQVRQLAERLGGFLVSSQMYGGQDAQSASLTLRVPSARCEEARAEIRKLGLRMESEKLEAQDVTKQYVDQQARLRNLRAQEAQYLTILKQAKTVKDTLEVSDKLNEVRGEIEQQQAEFDALSKQVETVAITVSLHAEAEAQVFGLRWRPLYQLKLAAREGLDAVADYAVAMTALLFYLPVVLLWLATILVGAAGSWRILRWAGRRLFANRKPATVSG